MFSLTWPACVQIYWNKRKRLHKEKSSTLTGLVWDTNMTAVSLFWDTNMAVMTSCENTQYQQRVKIAGDLSKKTIAIENFFAQIHFRYIWEGLRQMSSF